MLIPLSNVNTCKKIISPVTPLPHNTHLNNNITATFNDIIIKYTENTKQIIELNSKKGPIHTQSVLLLF